MKEGMRMKATKKRFFGILLGLALVLGMMPALGMRVHAKSIFSDLVIASEDTAATLSGVLSHPARTVIPMPTYISTPNVD